MKWFDIVFAARLRKRSPLSAILKNVTHWNSEFLMSHCYAELRLALRKPDEAEVDEFLPSSAEGRKNDEVISLVEEFQSVKLDLQRSDISLSKVREKFVKSSAQLSSIKNRITPNVRIVPDVMFKNALIMMQNGWKDQLTPDQR